MLLGLPATFVQSTAAPQNFVLTTFDPWIQDDWRISRRLTLNLGLRWEPWLGPTDSDGPMVGFVPGMQSTLAPHVATGLVFSGDPGIPGSIFRDHWAAMSPRTGFAWDVFGNSKLIVRAGYGFFRAGTEFFGMQRTIATTIPGRASSVSITNPASTANPYAGYAGSLPASNPTDTSSALAALTLPSTFALSALDPNAKPEYTQSWNFTIERQLTHDSALKVSYVGNHYVHGMMTYNIDPAVYGPGATTSNEPSRVLYPGFASVLLGASNSHGNYNSLQVQYTKRTAHGLTIHSNYTYSKALDITSSGAQGVSTNVGLRDPFNLNLDKGPADFDLTQQFKLMLVYDLPKLTTGSRALQAMANGWQVNAISVARTGLPFTCRSGVDNSLSGVNLDHCTQVLANTARPAGVDRVQEWFNTAAFTTNAIGTFGTAGRNSMRRPGAFNANLSVFRIFPIRERVKLEFRAEMFNLFNHPNLDLFTSAGGYVNYQVVTSPTFGQITSASDPRLFQLALKLRF